MPKKWLIVPRYQGTIDHWVGHNKYIETLLIWLHLIFIYLILQINKIFFQIYSKNHVLAVQFVPPRIAGGGKIKRTSLISTSHYHYILFRTKNVLSISTSQELSSEKISVTCTTKFRVDFFLWTVAI